MAKRLSDGDKVCLPIIHKIIQTLRKVETLSENKLARITAREKAARVDKYKKSKRD